MTGADSSCLLSVSGTYRVHVTDELLMLTLLCVSEVFPLQMEGVRLVVNKGLSNHFQVSHTITLSTLAESGYRFGSTYVGSKQTGPAEVIINSTLRHICYLVYI